MIKAVIQAIPIYPMNCFRFPLKSCKELNSLIANFWWEGKAYGGKTHWKAWESMTNGKSTGGMGFRDLSIMNDALLAKTAWRLLLNPNDLWARVLKSVYFPRDEFLDAKKGYKASWCWSSILDGRNFLKKDLRWDIGNGAAIRIWGDNWVPKVNFLEKPSNHENLFVSEGRVCDLIVNGEWDLTPIDQYLPAEVKCAIYEIPIPNNGLEDKLVWTNAKDGVYMVKLGYHRGKEGNSVSTHKAGTSTVIPTTCWKSIWKIKIIPRVQQFIWRLLNNAIATNAALFRRKRSQGSQCPVCAEADETIEHLFFHCPWTRCVWFGCTLSARMEAASMANFNAWWIAITGTPSLSKQELSLICWILWFIWKQRNEMVFNHKEPNPVDVIELAMKSNFEFWVNCDRNYGDSVMLKGCNVSLVKWTPPPVGSLKINCDGAFSPNKEGAAIGVICRDNSGNFRWGYVDKVKSISAFMTEALAMKKALLLAVDLGHDKVDFETDCLPLLNCVEAKSPDLSDWRSRSIVQDVICLLSSKVGFSMSFTPRRGNRAADSLAADAYKGVCPIGWVSQPTPSLLSFLTLDAKETDVVNDDTSSPILSRNGD